MLSELTIGQYRGISNLKLDNLGQINIIAGANNTGKTSILEVIRSLECPNSIFKWDCIARRSMDTFTSSWYRLTPFQVMKNVFSMKNNGFVGRRVEFSGVFNKNKFVFSMKGKIIQEVLNVSNIDPEVVDCNLIRQCAEDGYCEMNALVLSFILNDKECGKEKISEMQYRLEEKEQSDNIIQIVNNIIHISPAQHTRTRQYFSSLFQDPDLYEEFVKVMKLFDSGFLTVNIMGEESPLGGGNYIVLSKGHKEGILLDAYGDGMKKAMLLLSAVLQAKDGILLLDEFETAIHISAMEHVFRFILEVAIKNNVQIFMTSHSLEAIETTLKCMPEYQKQCLIPIFQLELQKRSMMNEQKLSMPITGRKMKS